MNKITVYGTRWCVDCRRAVRILDERQIDYDWVDVDKDLEGEAFVKQVNLGNRSVPTILFPDSTILVEPSAKLLREKLDQLQ